MVSGNTFIEVLLRCSVEWVRLVEGLVLSVTQCFIALH